MMINILVQNKMPEQSKVVTEVQILATSKANFTQVNPSASGCTISCNVGFHKRCTVL
eukprot:00991.XXX_1395_1621_1 [CDS] Oithona nana genome sequencing.